MQKKTAAVSMLITLVMAFAGAQTLGKVDYIEGSVELTRDGVPVRGIDIGTPIENMDVVKTGGDGSVSISFSPESGLTGTLQIVPGTSALIRSDQISGTTTNEVKLMAGSVNLKVKRIAGAKSAAQVRTSSAVLGVRGTEFVVASFNATSLVACKEGEVFCYAASEVTGTVSPKSGASSVPGTLVEVQESGKVATGKFPAGDFETSWNSMRDKWKAFQVELMVSNAMPLLDNLAQSWNTHYGKVEKGSAVLRSNQTLKAWLKNPSRPSGSFGDWMAERRAVMKDLVGIRGDMIMTLIVWYRLEEIVPNLPASVMDQKLSTGQTVREFVSRYKKSSKTVSDAASLFHAAEKQYMLRNDGVSPFSEF